MAKQLWVVGLMLYGVLGWSASQAEAVIVINELLADPAGDANQDGSVHSTQDEFVELVNTDPDSVSLANWSLSDLVRTRHVFSGSASIPGNGLFVVFGGGTPQGFAQSAVASGGTLGLNNGGDTITLSNAGASPVDVVTYGAEGGQDVALTRSPDATGPFTPHSGVSPLAFSPGTTVDGLTQLPVLNTDPVTPETPSVSTEPSFLSDPTVSAGSSSSTVAPEPSSLALLGLGLLSAPLTRRRKKRNVPLFNGLR